MYSSSIVAFCNNSVSISIGTKSSNPVLTYGKLSLLGSPFINTWPFPSDTFSPVITLSTCKSTIGLSINPKSTLSIVNTWFNVPSSCVSNVAPDCWSLNSSTPSLKYGVYASMFSYTYVFVPFKIS